MKYIDLSHEIESDMPVYPGDKDIELKKVRNLTEDGYSAYALDSCMHIGTHIDCPMHMIDDNRHISDFSIERFIGNAVLIDARGQNIIDIKDEYYRIIKENDIVLLYTGFDSKYGTAEYYQNHPVMTKDFAEFLSRKKIKMLGIDMPSPDKEPFEIHKILLQSEIFILENLTNLSKLLYVDKFEVYAQPLKIKTEASYVRAFACYQGY